MARTLLRELVLGRVCVEYRLWHISGRIPVGVCSRPKESSNTRAKTVPIAHKHVVLRKSWVVGELSLQVYHRFRPKCRHHRRYRRMDVGFGCKLRNKDLVDPVVVGRVELW